MSNDETTTATPPTPTDVAVAEARNALRRAMDEADDARSRSGRASIEAGERAETLRCAELRESACFDDLANEIAAKRREATRLAAGVEPGGAS